MQNSSFWMKTSSFWVKNLRRPAPSPTTDVLGSGRTERVVRVHAQPQRHSTYKIEQF